MKQITIALSTLFIFVGCSHAPKAADKTAPPAPAASANADATKKAAPEKAKAPKASASTSTSAAELTCKNGSDERSLSVKSKDEGCDVVYTKNGQPEVVGTARSGVKHCQDISDRIAGRLKTAGFDCN